MTEKRNVAQKVPADVALIVFGTDRRKKRHASRFGSETAARALEAARSMGMRTLPVVSDEQREIALKLPKGSISPKGRTVVPLVRPALYDKLLAVAGPGSDPVKPGEQPSSPSASDAKPAANAADAKPDATTGWSKLVKGSVVLAKESLEDMGWYESIVQSIDGEVLTLRWQAWPDYPKFNRKVAQVALLHPKMVKPC
jgi:hypothetical protein